MAFPKRSDRPTKPPAVCRGLLAALAATLPILAGCPTEVPYESSESTADVEAPPFESAQPAAGDATDSSIDNSSIDNSSIDEGLIDEPPAEDRYGDRPAVKADKQFPWETDNDGQASPEVERLFGATDNEVKPSPDPEPAASEPDEEKNDFGDFLGDAYAGLLNEPDRGEAASQDEGVESRPPPAESPFEPPAEAVAKAEEAPPVSRDDLGGATDPPADAIPEDLSELDLPFELPSTETQSPQLAPKPPTTTEPADSKLLAELWGDEQPAVEGEVDPPTSPEPEPPSAGGLPFGGPAKVTADPPRVAPEPSLPFEAPRQEPAPPSDTVASEPLPPPIDVFDEPGFEPEPELSIASAGSAGERAPLLESAAAEPLPAVPVLTYNTRHLAWLLGGKLGLAELADLDGATPSEVAEWSREVKRLSDSLKLTETGGSDRGGDDPAKRIQAVMARAGRLGKQLADSHGLDHAALMEIALKSNALLVVAERRPDLAGPVGRAIREAAARAMLPRFLWEETVKTLDREPTADEAHDAVVRLHQRVESFLR